MWCIPPKHSGEFVYHMEDVLEVYHRPYDRRFPVVCLDETFKQLIGEVREPLAGWRHVELTGSRTAKDWATVVKGLVDAPRYRHAERIVLVMDQLNTHGPWSLYGAFGPDEARRVADKLEIHHTPKHGSWLNMAEIELSAFERDLPERVGDASAMACHVAAWEKRRNGAKVKADWQFATADARV